MHLESLKYCIILLLLTQNNLVITKLIDFCSLHLAGVDYRVATVMLTFNQSGMRCTTIEIISDETSEIPEEFSVILTSVSPSGIIMDDTTCITIVDPIIEDRRFMYTSVFYCVPRCIQSGMPY